MYVSQSEGAGPGHAGNETRGMSTSESLFLQAVYARLLLAGDGAAVRGYVAAVPTISNPTRPRHSGFR